MTKEQLFSIMKNKYEEMSGGTVYPESDVGLRFSALSAVLAELDTQLEEYKNQNSPFTATGRFLDAFAAEYGLKRKPAEKAHGEVRIMADSPFSDQIIIPKNTLLITESLNPITFVTDNDVTFDNSSTSQTVSVTSTSCGKVNISPWELCRFCNEKTPFLKVYNLEPINSGCDEESDGELRKRILDFYTGIPFSNNCTAVKAVALSYPGVSKACVYRDDGTFSVYIKWDKEETAPLSDIAKFIAGKIPSANNVTVSCGEKLIAEITVSANDFTRSGAAEEIENAVKKYFDGLDFNTSASISEIYRIITALDCCKSFAVGDISGIPPTGETKYYEASVTVTGA